MLKSNEAQISADFKLKFWDQLQKVAKRRDSIVVNSARHLLNIGISNVSDEKIIKFVQEMHEMIAANPGLLVQQIGEESANFFYKTRFASTDIAKAIRLNIAFVDDMKFKTATIFNKTSSAFHNGHVNFFEKMQ